MNLKFPNKMLFKINDSIKQLQHENFALYMLLLPRIRQWNNDNGVHIQSLINKIVKLQEEFFEFEGEKEERKIKFITPESIVASPAKYETKIVRKKTLFRKEITQQILVYAEIKEKKFPPEPVLKEGRLLEEYNKQYEELVNKEVNIIF